MDLEHLIEPKIMIRRLKELTYEIETPHKHRPRVARKPQTYSHIKRFVIALP